MATYIVVSGKHTRWIDGEYVRFGPGDPIELNEEQAEWFGERVRPLTRAEREQGEPQPEEQEPPKSKSRRTRE